MNPQASRLTVGHELPFWVPSRPRDSLSSSVRITALSLPSRFRLRNKVLSIYNEAHATETVITYGKKKVPNATAELRFSCWRIVPEFASNTSTLRECVSTHPVIWTTNVAYLFCKNITKCRSHRYPLYLPSVLPASLTLASSTKKEDSPTICQGSSALLLRLFLDPFPEKFGFTGARKRALLLCR